MVFRVFRTDIVYVLCGGEGHSCFPRKSYDVIPYFHDLLYVRVMAYFQKEIFSPEYIPILKRRLFRIIESLIEEQAVHFAVEAGREGDDSFVVFAQKVLVRPWLVVKTLKMRLSDDFYEVVPADLVLDQKYEMIIFFSRVLAEPVAWCHVGLHAQYGLNSRGLGFLIKLHRAVKNAMVGYRQGVHSEFLCAGNKVVYLRQPVKQGIVTVRVKMYEFGHKIGLNFF